MAMNTMDAVKVFAIGGVIGAVGFYLLSKANINLGGAPAPAAPMAQFPTGVAPGTTPTVPGQVPMQMPGMPTTMYASVIQPSGTTLTAMINGIIQRFGIREIANTSLIIYCLTNYHTSH